MKTESNMKPIPILDLGNGKYHINYNVVEVEREEIGVIFEYNTVLIEGLPTYERVIESLIRERYGISDELAIQRQRDIKTDEFAEYCEYADSCKELARECMESWEK
ncbi:hypothetical protein [Bacteroides reticulotermitis]|uniref:Uncharacterized protein n=2 Tax=Bacteroides reticulotermitis TaxID=1133319 RepID=W4UQU7_9BACE|nr:hypothetical protein [Bacteroides reticulotermitis]MBB4043827.1 hypothetical protein [Bacteroides reticulotermitis]GAE83346.1 hypothetical protein JCM10512_1612 [Bacteroides reticulotermitis JCM 10512]